MSEVLYRKYRPKTFGDVLGQEHVTKVLEEEVARGSVAHAYLFSGTRGTGKTSVARILARALGTSDNDIYEIDAASNTSVDDIRALNESVHTQPFDSKYKMYILDEVHMLSKSASNALLKTLEEPPSHVIFVLATTETHKILDTILSRCQVFTFKKPSLETLAALVTDITTREGYSIDAASSELLALLGDGSFRDTLGMLQKVLSSSGTKKIGEETVRMVVGAPEKKLVHDFLSALAAKDAGAALGAIHTASGQNIDMVVFQKLTLHLARVILLSRFGAAHVVGEVSDSDKTFIEEIEKVKGESGAGIFSSKTLLLLLRALEATPGSYIQTLPLELSVVDILV